MEAVYADGQSDKARKYYHQHVDKVKVERYTLLHFPA